jgi:hypothetical protein
MARTVTMTELENGIRRASDTVGLTDASGRYAPDTLMEYASQGWSQLYNHIIKHGQEDYMSREVYTTAAGTADYALPSGFYLDKGCDTVISGQTVVFDRWLWEERHKYDNVATWAPGYPCAYAIIGSNISFRPSPNGVHTVNLWYYPAPAKLTTASGPIDCKAGFEEYIIHYAAAQVKIQDDRDPSDNYAMMDRALQLVNAMCASRSRSNPMRVIQRWRTKNRILRPF